MKSDAVKNNISYSGEAILKEHSSVTEDGIRIVVMGAIQHGGDGCLCSAISMVKILLDYAESLGEYDVAIVDSQAGPEVLGRGLASSFDCNVIVSEPTAKSAEVSRQVKRLADDLGIRENVLIVNKTDCESDVSDTARLIGIDTDRTVGVPFSKDVVEADKKGVQLLDAYPDSPALAAIREAGTMIERSIGW